MEQALSYFNSGKYKEAYNQLNSIQSNIQSYQANLIVCQYLANRSVQSSQQCLKKLCTLLAKKNKKDNEHYERLTQQFIKYNIGILLIINGKKQNAYTLFNDLYHKQKCFIDYLKYRMLFLLMELNIGLKSSVKAINLAGKYLNSSYESRNSPTQWISAIFHQHSKAYSCQKEELRFMVSILLSQAMMQLNAPENCLFPNEQSQKDKNTLLDKVRKRKNNTNKYYEINLLMIDRFYEAQKEFHKGNIQKSIKLLHFPTIQLEYEQMPQTKIITNIYSSFSHNNIGIVNFSKGKKAVSLHFLQKAQTLLTKGCTGVEDKDLQLFSSNYAHHNVRIGFNLGLLALSMKSSHSYPIFQSLKKNNQQRIDFKYWYRIGQSELEYYHQNYHRLSFQQRQSLLECALKSFSNSLVCLSKREIPNLNISETFSKFEIMKEDQIETIIIQMNGQSQNFRQNIILLICYISLMLKRYYKVILLAKELLKSQKNSESSRLYACYYLVQSYARLERLKQAIKYARQAQKLAKSMKKIKLAATFQSNNKFYEEEVEVQHLITHQSTYIKAKQGQYSEGISQLEKLQRTSKSTGLSLRYLKQRQKGADNKFF